MKITGLFAFLALVLSAVLGFVAESQGVGPRPEILATAADQSWYAALPIDPARATSAFLERVPAATRARAVEVSEGWFPILGLRVGVLAAAIALILFSGCSARMRDLAQRVTRLGPAQDAIYCLQFFAVLFFLTLPLTTYTGYLRRRGFGFSDIHFQVWLTDTLVQWAVLTAFTVVGAVLMFALIRRRPQTWPRWTLGVYVSLVAIQIFISPAFIEPLFNRIEPMPDGPIRQVILSLARANGIGEADVFVSNASKQSKFLNAHVTGIAGTTRIVLNDTTLAAASPATLRFVMAHEIGHYVLNHAGKWIVFNALVMAVGFAFIGWGVRFLLGRFGARWKVAQMGDIGALPVFWVLFVVFGYLVIPVNYWFSRLSETEADLYGLNASQEPIGMAEFMIHDADAGPRDPSPIQVTFFYHHPPPKRRIETAMRWRAEFLQVRTRSP